METSKVNEILKFEGEAADKLLEAFKKPTITKEFLEELKNRPNRKEINKFIVDSKNAEEFINFFNENVISEEFLNECKETAKLFKKDNMTVSKEVLPIFKNEMANELLKDINKNTLNDELIQNCEEILKLLIENKQEGKTEEFEKAMRMCSKQYKKALDNLAK